MGGHLISPIAKARLDEAQPRETILGARRLGKEEDPRVQATTSGSRCVTEFSQAASLTQRNPAQQIGV